MLQNKLFTFTDILAEENIVKANVKLNPGHQIFEGHFPGEPVLPGVCMTQMVKELLEIHIQKQARLIKASDIKFLSIVTPQQDKLIQIELKTLPVDDGIRVDARLLDIDVPLFKFKGIFQKSGN
jgi:3-hydroxyacyl-[acyl-carrier-protein] dehydratase